MTQINSGNQATIAAYTGSTNTGDASASEAGATASTNTATGTTTGRAGATASVDSLSRSGSAHRGRRHGKHSAKDIADDVKAGRGTNQQVADAFSAYCTSHGLPQTQSSFGQFAAAESPKLQANGLNSSQAQATLSQGEDFALNGFKAKNFTVGQGQA